jgi:SAM-dependent methyltransferase
MDDLTRYNERTYARLWRFARYQPPESTPWWPLAARLASTARERLELGPGPYPKLPVEGTHFVDLVPKVLDALRERGGLVHQGELEEVAFADGAFELVGLFEVLEHVREDERLLAELARIVRPGGHLVLALPLQMRLFNTWDKYAGHMRRYEPDELQDKVARAGFEIVEFEVRPDPLGRFWALMITIFCHVVPGFAMWFTEAVLFPAALKQIRLVYHPGSEWKSRAADAGECTVVCRRV